MKIYFGGKNESVVPVHSCHVLALAAWKLKWYRFKDRWKQLQYSTHTYIQSFKQS